jgi:hypothetical protein
MAIDFRGDSYLEMDALISKSKGLGIDGLFVDCTISATRWKERFMRARTAALETNGGAGDDIHSDAEDGQVPVQPVAAISTLVLVGVLIAACGVYAWTHRQTEGDGHGSYKVMTSPHVEDDMMSVSVHSLGPLHDPEQKGSLQQQGDAGDVEAEQ